MIRCLRLQQQRAVSGAATEILQKENKVTHISLHSDWATMSEVKYNTMTFYAQHFLAITRV